jgi:hypothetical protein
MMGAEDDKRVPWGVHTASGRLHSAASTGRDCSLYRHRIPAKRAVGGIVARLRFAYDMTLIESRGEALVGVLQSCGKMHIADTRSPLAHG